VKDGGGILGASVKTTGSKVNLYVQQEPQTTFSQIGQ